MSLICPICQKEMVRNLNNLNINWECINNSDNHSSYYKDEDTWSWENSDGVILNYTFNSHDCYLHFFNTKETPSRHILFTIKTTFQNSFKLSQKYLKLITFA
jgi:hypothetical protein